MRRLLSGVRPRRLAWGTREPGPRCPDLRNWTHESQLDHPPPVLMGLLFPSGTGNPLYHRTPGSWWNRARIAAGRPNLRFHDLGHKGAPRPPQSGATLKELMARLGHTTRKAALVYQHAAADRDQLIAERLSAQMASEVRR